MKHFQVLHLLIILILSTPSSIKAFDFAKPGCNDTCGQVRIPYPFGIGENCSLNKWYAVDCNSSIPYLSALNNLELLYVDLEQQTVDVNVSQISHCSNSVSDSYDQIPSIDLNESPYVFSELHNVFIVKGCGNAVILEDRKVMGGCSTTCSNVATNESDYCAGVRCCQTIIPDNLKSYTIDLTPLKVDGDGSCASAFLVGKGWYTSEMFGDTFIMRNNSFIPISLMWILTDYDLYEIPNCWEKERGKMVHVNNIGSVDLRKCFCGLGREGNPYLHYQCEESDFCRMCGDAGGICHYDETKPYLQFNCETKIYYSTQGFARSQSPLGIILGVSISMGLLFLAKFILELQKFIKRTITKREKDEFFKRNGGLLIKQQKATDMDLVDKTILFTSKELETATDRFNENRILGRGGQGTVYKGMLADGRIVAVKKSKKVDQSQLEQFINEVVILSQVNHRNVVKLLGCCLETEVPLLVSEFVPNGTLYDFIQDETCEFPFSLNMRLQIASEVAGALAYLHSATSLPIYHRDIKTTNILLDEKYRAKVSDFGTSRFVSVDKTHLTTLVKGTFGYFDPEYFQSSQFTEKSDVYSFGVVLLELLTREKPILTNFDEHRSLAAHFTLAIEEDCVMSIFDTVVVNEESNGVLLDLANLAMRCLNSNGKNRPTMKEVALELEGMRMSHLPSTVDNYLEHMNKSEEISLRAYDRESTSTSTSTTTSFNDSNSD